jgi:CMD domain protein
MSAATPDVVDLLTGIAPGSKLDAIRAQRPEARENTQKSYLALFEPQMQGNVTARERFAVAAFVAGLHRQDAVAQFYASKLKALDAGSGIADAVAAEVALGATQGPYGTYPRGKLTTEDAQGPIHRVSDAHRAVLGQRLSAALEHAHLLVFRPRDASAEALQALLDAGWSSTDIVTLSQLVAFLSYQIRVVTGLRALSS